MADETSTLAENLEALRLELQKMAQTVNGFKQEMSQMRTAIIVSASTITDREQAVLQYNRQVIEAHARAVASDNDAIARAPPRLRPLRPRRALPQAELVGSSPALVKQAWWPWRPEDALEVWIDEEGPCLEAVM